MGIYESPPETPETWDDVVRLANTCLREAANDDNAVGSELADHNERWRDRDGGER